MSDLYYDGGRVLLDMTIAGQAETKGSWDPIRTPTRVVLKNSNPRARAMAELIGWSAKARTRGVAPYDGRVALHVVAWLVKPPTKAKKNRRDGDKVLRLVADALSSIVYIDDETIDDWHIRKRIDSNNPRMRIIVRTMEDE
jgi:Holliday junction resolvase RusA-like endonuclease